MARHHFKPNETLKLLEPSDLGLVYTSLQRLEIAADPVLVKSDSSEIDRRRDGGRGGCGVDFH